MCQYTKHDQNSRAEMQFNELNSIKMFESLLLRKIGLAAQLFINEKKIN